MVIMKKALCLAMTVLFLFLFVGCGDSGGNTKKCSVCGDTYYAGDAGGNYKSIARSGMCKSCKRGYDTQKEIKDYFELNP